MAGMDDNTIASPAFCKNGCGFYGSPNTEELCSKCFRDLKKDDPSGNGGVGGAGANATTCRAENSSHVSSSGPATSTAQRNAPINMLQSNISSSSSSSDQDPNILNLKMDEGPSQGQLPLPLPTSTDMTGCGAATAATALPVHVPVAATVSISEAEMGSVESHSEMVVVGSADTGSGETTPRKKNRCLTCNKKTGLTGFSCRCGGLYCSLHRHADDHQCSFDYKTEGKNAIRKSNPKVQGEKVARI